MVDSGKRLDMAVNEDDMAMQRTRFGVVESVTFVVSILPYRVTMNGASLALLVLFTRVYFGVGFKI